MALRAQGLFFIHVPKTGGIWTSDVLQVHCAPARTSTEVHCPRRFFSREDIGDRLVFSNVRDPWTWYASWYFHVLKQSDLNKGLRKEILLSYGRGSIEFRDVLYGMTHPEATAPMRRLGGYWQDTEFDEWAVWSSAGQGFCSYSFDYMWEGGIDAIVPVDRMESGLTKLMGRPIMRSFRVVRNERRIFLETSYEQLYDGEMLEWVAQADRTLIERFGFEPFKRSPKDIYCSDEVLARLPQPPPSRGLAAIRWVGSLLS